MASRFQQIFERPENALIIVNHGNDEAGRMVSDRVSCNEASNLPSRILTE